MIALQFAGGEYFVSASDLHNTTWTVDPREATTYATLAEAQQAADNMARTQGIRLVPASLP